MSSNLVDVDGTQVWRYDIYAPYELPRIPSIIGVGAIDKTEDGRDRLTITKEDIQAVYDWIINADYHSKRQERDRLFQIFALAGNSKRAYELKNQILMDFYKRTDLALLDMAYAIVEYCQHKKRRHRDLFEFTNDT